MEEKEKGNIVKISGPLVVAERMKGCEMYEVCRVGEERLMAETIGLEGDKAYVQVYEDTSGVKPGEPIWRTGSPLVLELGPGIMTSFFDGVQRPLIAMREEAGEWVTRGIEVPALDPKKRWDFTPTAEEGKEIAGGDILGTVPESKTVTHRVLVPPDVKKGKLTEIKEGKFTVNDVIATVEEDGKGRDLTMKQKWPVRTGRPIKEKLDPYVPLLTGQRIYDTVFPMAKGGTAGIPGGFGTGKTVMQHQVARWADSKVVIFVGCGERGNEMTEVLEDFPELTDPYTGEKLMERSVLVANTSNMPVAAREASVYTGITLSEYYRDMGYDVAMMADSTSRWAEALREMSGRMEEMPGEEGYPAYLSSRIADFYERAGRCRLLGTDERYGSVSLIGAVSPPGGDLSEPVSQATLRIVSVFWALSVPLADRRHFPAIDWLRSYSLYHDTLKDWSKENVAEDFTDQRDEAMVILSKESELEEIVKLIGPDALPESEREILEVARMIREDFLQQNAYHDVDSFCSVKKQYLMLKTILRFHERAKNAVSMGVGVDEISEMPVIDEIARMKYMPDEEFEEKSKELANRIDKGFEELIGE